jgi:hypothetical protein
MRLVLPLFLAVFVAAAPLRFEITLDPDGLELRIDKGMRATFEKAQQRATEP